MNREQWYRRRVIDDEATAQLTRAELQASSTMCQANTPFFLRAWSYERLNLVGNDPALVQTHSPVCINAWGMPSAIESRVMHPTTHPHHPANQLARIRHEWGGHRDLWVFGYASLIWRPEFEAVEQRPATVYGYHRALEMRSTVNRGTPECSGLVFALVSGGSCRGMAYRMDLERADEELEQLWLREMPTGVYNPKWLPCRTPQGTVHALAFTLSRSSPSHVGPLPDDAILEIFRTACGKYGTTLDYLLGTAASLRGCGIVDREIERLVELARQHALTA